VRKPHNCTIPADAVARLEIHILSLPSTRTLAKALSPPTLAICGATQTPQYQSGGSIIVFRPDGTQASFSPVYGRHSEEGGTQAGAGTFVDTRRLIGTNLLGTGIRLPLDSQ